MPRLTFPIMMLIVAVAGCEKRPSDAPALVPPGTPPNHVSAPHPAAATPAAAGAALHWDDPAAWKKEQPSGGMRYAQYRVPHTGADTDDGELVVFYFGAGQGGSVQDNLARWESQFKQPDGSPISPAKVDKRTVKGLPVSVVHVEGTFASGMMMGTPASHDHWALLGAIAESTSGPWFFKLTGPAATVAQASGDFDKLVWSLHE